MNPNGLQGSAVEAKLSGAAQNAVCAQASRFAFTNLRTFEHFLSGPSSY